MDFEERSKSEKSPEQSLERMEERDLAEFERRLRFAIRRHEAPLGLKSRVIAQARSRRRAQHGRGWIMQRIAASALLAALFGGVAVYHQNEERRKGEQAREQVMTALRITHRTLDRVSEHLAENAR